MIPQDLIREFLARKNDVSNSKLEHLSYRSTSTSFGPFSWEHASRLEESCDDLIENFWTSHGHRINRDDNYWPDDGTIRCQCVQGLLKQLQHAQNIREQIVLIEYAIELVRIRTSLS